MARVPRLTAPGTVQTCSMFVVLVRVGGGETTPLPSYALGVVKHNGESMAYGRVVWFAGLCK